VGGGNLGGSSNPLSSPATELMVLFVRVPFAVCSVLPSYVELSRWEFILENSVSFFLGL
jgi:hypothetical protein